MDAAEAAVEFTDAEIVRVGRVADWAFSRQAPGAELGQRDVLVPLSRGGRVLTLWRTGTALSYFEMLADGVPELSFKPLSAERVHPSARAGAAAGTRRKPAADRRSAHSIRRVGSDDLRRSGAGRCFRAAGSGTAASDDVVIYIDVN